MSQVGIDVQAEYFACIDVTLIGPILRLPSFIREVTKDSIQNYIKTTPQLCVHGGTLDYYIDLGNLSLQIPHIMFNRTSWKYVAENSESDLWDMIGLRSAAPTLMADMDSIIYSIALQMCAVWNINYISSGLVHSNVWDKPTVTEIGLSRTSGRDWCPGLWEPTTTWCGRSINICDDTRRYQTRLRRIRNRFVPNESQVLIYHNQGVVDSLSRSPTKRYFKVKLQHDCLEFWRETVVGAPYGGMCKVTTSDVKQSRASQCRASVDIVHRDYALCLWSLMIPYKWFPALTGHRFLRAWRRSSRSRTLHDGYV